MNTKRIDKSTYDNGRSQQTRRIGFNKYLLDPAFPDRNASGDLLFVARYAIKADGKEYYFQADMTSKEFDATDSATFACMFVDSAHPVHPHFKRTQLDEANENDD